MSRVQVSILGVLILISFVLTTISTFTKYWIVWHNGLFKGHFGIVPFQSFKVYRQGCSHGVRINFFGILIFCLLIACLQVTAFTFTAINVVNFKFWMTTVVNQSMGSSAFLAIISAVIACLATAQAGNIAKRYCN
ncbi:Protein CBG04951 [Caenorhabditis briggsae]|uniref:Protein CBG04951 n=1 Tax=Caenorhabditis briggsae TaxID=6238 RepID=A8WYV7_CAEBR|nr:Protein CBG04951 [Caenorhabditis briggsae]CAP25565.1 Protein CBG04951 [Caenorhabditis briggsae]